jgi:hypothetical protein
VPSALEELQPSTTASTSRGLRRQRGFLTWMDAVIDTHRACNSRGKDSSLVCAYRIDCARLPIKKGPGADLVNRRDAVVHPVQPSLQGHGLGSAMEVGLITASAAISVLGLIILLVISSNGPPTPARRHQWAMGW